MTAYRIPLFVAASISLAGLGVFLLAGQGSPRDGWSALWEDQRALAREYHRSARLDDSLRQVSRQNALRNALIEELIEGRRGHVEVTATFDRLDRELPSAPSSLHGPDDAGRGERACRQVIEFARSDAEDRPGVSAEEVVARLEGELELHLCEHGSVDLSAGG